jgi:DNA-binding MarR family transcriptional regulator
MSETQAHFLMLVLKHTPSKPKIHDLAAAVNLTTAATSMRITRLKHRLEENRFEAKDLPFLEKLIQYSGGTTNTKAVAEELGMKPSAISMRLTRLRKKFGGSAGSSPGKARAARSPRKEKKESIEEVKCEDMDDGMEEVKCEDIDFEMDTAETMMKELERIDTL